MLIYRFTVGDCVMWRGGWGTQAAKPARIVGLGEKNDRPVYDLDSGHWAYEYQLDDVVEATYEEV